MNRINVNGVNLDSFTMGYLECALWVGVVNFSEDGFCETGGEWDVFDIHPDSLKRIAEVCEDFYDSVCDELSMLDDELGTIIEDDRHGLDFFLTQNGHGAGFWDRDYGKLGDKLTEAAKAQGPADLHVGDDGRLHYNG